MIYILTLHIPVTVVELSPACGDFHAYWWLHSPAEEPGVQQQCSPALGQDVGT